MDRLFRTAPAAIVWLVALVLVTVTACSSGPAPAASGPTPERTHQGNMAPVSPESETVLEVPDGPTVVIPAGAASGDGQLEVDAEADETLDSYDGVFGWEIHIDNAELTGQATITFPLKLEPDDPLPLVGYRDDSTGEYVPVKVELVDGHPTVRTEHFSFWFIQSLVAVSEGIAGFVRGAAVPFPDVDKPECSGATDAARKVEVNASEVVDVHWCLGMGEQGKPVLTIVNPLGHTVEFESSSHLVPERTELSYSNTVEELVLALGYAADESGHNFGLIGPGETKTFTLAGTGRHQVDLTASGAAFIGTATRVAAQTLASVVGGGAVEKMTDKKTAQMASYLLQAVQSGVCVGDLEDAGAMPGRVGIEYTAAKLTAISSALVGCSDVVLKGAVGPVAAFFVGSAVAVLGGVKMILAALSGIIGAMRGTQILQLDVDEDAVIADADATEIVTVRPFEDGTADQAEVLATSSVECGGDGLSIRADTTRCILQSDVPADETPTLINVCFTDPSGQARVVCPARDGSWHVMENVQPLESGIPTTKYGTADPAEGNIFRMELVDGGHCVIASGAGPFAPDGYTGWSGVCELPGEPEANVLWGTDESVDDLHPFLVGVSDGGFLQVAAGPEGGEPQHYEVARAYR